MVKITVSMKMVTKPLTYQSNGISERARVYTTKLERCKGQTWNMVNGDTPEKGAR